MRQESIKLCAAELAAVARLRGRRLAQLEAERRLAIGNTPTCEDCGESQDHCTCEDSDHEN